MVLFLFFSGGVSMKKATCITWLFLVGVTLLYAGSFTWNGLTFSYDFPGPQPLGEPVPTQMRHMLNNHSIVVDWQGRATLVHLVGILVPTDGKACIRMAGGFFTEKMLENQDLFLEMVSGPDSDGAYWAFAWFRWQEKWICVNAALVQNDIFEPLVETFLPESYLPYFR